METPTARIVERKTGLAALDTLEPGDLRRIVTQNITRLDEATGRARQHLGVLAKMIGEVTNKVTKRRLQNILDGLTAGPRRHYGFGLNMGTPPRAKTRMRLLMQQAKFGMTGAAVRNANGQKGHPTKRQTPGRVEMFT